MSIAAKVQEQFSKRVGRLDRGVKQAGFLVLWKTSMPSILTEIGFISNPDESKYLLNDTNQNFIASAIFRAFRDYKNEMEGNTKSNSVEKQETDQSIQTEIKLNPEVKVENKEAR